MSKMIQIRNVPEDLHRTLKSRAALSGMSLSDYLLADLRKKVARPTMDELRERLRGRTPVEVGKRITLDFSKVSSAQFESLRTQYHRQQQDTFFRSHTITGVTEHVVQRGESVWILSLREYDVPVWLFRQYNPELDLHNVRRGTRLNFPVLVENQRS